MKKTLLITLCILLTLSLFACSTNNPPSKENTENTQAQNEEATEAEDADLTFGIGETAVFESIKITADEIKVSEGSDFMTPSDGKVYVGVKFTVENISDKEQTISSMMLFDAYVDDVKASQNISGSVVLQEEMNCEQLDGSIAKGKKLIGVYAVEVDKGGKQIQLEVTDSFLNNGKASFVIDIPQ